ncbi:hypothetical protein BJ742DRAFT_859618 [Cladochytrium replicatum]|nr:hypothetical protein BJ742DRAFT_859618 [Cladochytrium replicatum]
MKLKEKVKNTINTQAALAEVNRYTKRRNPITSPITTWFAPPSHSNSEPSNGYHDSTPPPTRSKSFDSARENAHAVIAPVSRMGGRFSILRPTTQEPTDEVYVASMDSAVYSNPQYNEQPRERQKAYVGYDGGAAANGSGPVRVAKLISLADEDEDEAYVGSSTTSSTAYSSPRPQNRASIINTSIYNSSDRGPQTAPPYATYIPPPALIEERKAPASRYVSAFESIDFSERRSQTQQNRTVARSFTDPDVQSSSAEFPKRAHSIGATISHHRSSFQGDGGFKMKTSSVSSKRRTWISKLGGKSKSSELNDDPEYVRSSEAYNRMDNIPTMSIDEYTYRDD